MTLTIPHSGRRAVLHIGMPGSGTSALQSAFALNKNVLKAAQIEYPSHATDTGASRGHTTAGNASDLRHYLHRGYRDEVEGDRALGEFLDQVDASTSNTLLFSSEMLYHVKHDTDNLVRLRSELAKRDITLQIIAVVRNVAAHAQTSYAMFVKSGGYSGSFGSWIGSDGKPGRYICALRPNLERYVRTVGRSNMSVLHYESERSELVRSVLFDTIGAPEGMAVEYPSRPVNRRLTSDELRMFRFLNSRINIKQGARRIEKIVMTHVPFGSPYRSMRQSDLDFLLEKYQGQVSWVNDVFFSGVETVTVGSSEIEISEKSVEDASISGETKAVLEWLAELADLT